MGTSQEPVFDPAPWDNVLEAAARGTPHGGGMEMSVIDIRHTEELTHLRERVFTLEEHIRLNGMPVAPSQQTMPIAVPPASDGYKIADPAEEDWCAAGVRRVEEGSDGLWVRCRGVEFNPFTTCAGTVLLFGFVAFCAAQTVGDHCYTTEASQDGLSMVLKSMKCNLPRKEFDFWMKWVTVAFTWFYILTQDIWILFAVVLYFSKYGRLRLGPDDEPPEFSTYSWFAMIFSCGVASGLFFFSVAEPIWHYEPCWGPGTPAGPSSLGGKCKGDTWANRFSQLPDNERAQESMQLTLYHWGLHGWVFFSSA